MASIAPSHSGNGFSDSPKIAEWIKAGMAIYVGLRISWPEIVGEYPQPRDWIFVGKPDNGPRGIFTFEVACVWRN
jgi:hypothetical protein